MKQLKVLMAIKEGQIRYRRSFEIKRVLLELGSGEQGEMGKGDLQAVGYEQRHISKKAHTRNNE